MRYTFIREIGSGTYGRVYLAQCDRKRFAIKVVNLFDLDEEKREKVQSEIKIQKKLIDNPHVAKIIEYYNQNSDIHIVMKYYSKGDLYSRIVECQSKNSWLTEQAVLRCLADICFGLQFIHSNGVIHRDIKPENVFIDRYNRCVIGDFGLSRVVDSLKPIFLSKVGSHFYIAPEILKELPYSSSVDIFSLGCLLHTMCTHKITFMNPEDLMVEKEGSMIPTTEFPAHYSQNLIILISSMLECNPKSRPTASEVLNNQLLINFLRGGKRHKNMINRL